jgi:hypothetical protein
MSPSRTPRSRCTTLVLLLGLLAHAGCGDDGGGVDAGRDDAGGAGAPWMLVFQDLDAALISIAGTSSSDVWAVGADTRDGDGPLALHYDGGNWTREITGVEEDLWWVHVAGERSVYMGGTGGAIVHWDGDAFERMDTPASGIVFGIWGAAEDELWAVGGEPDIAPGFVWRYDGRAWSDMTVMLPEEAQGPSVFKVWGRSRDDVWFVGGDGLAVHWDGEAFELADSGTTRRLFTVHGPPEGNPGFVAVGGLGDAVIVEHDGTQWHNSTPDPAPFELFGVFMASEDEGYAVGAEGTVVQRSRTAWKLLDLGLEPGHELFNPFHSVWVDPEGGVWTVGGNLLTATPDEGMLMHRGRAVSNEISR